MILPDGLSLRGATERDLPAITALRTSVGWAAHDWALRAALHPPGRTVVVQDRGGSVVAVGSGTAYGPLGFVGNMVVAAEHRRRGLGSFVLRDVLADLEARGCTRLELYATPEGRPLYRRHGFEPADPSATARLSREAGWTQHEEVTVAEGTGEELEAVSAYDAPRFGGPRTGLLAAMLDDPDRPLLVARRRAEIAGYAWLRADGDRLGPFVADDTRAAESIVRAAFDRAVASAELTLNLPTANRSGVGWLEAHGAIVTPWDGRMARGPAIERRDETIYSNAVGALG